MTLRKLRMQITELSSNIYHQRSTDEITSLEEIIPELEQFQDNESLSRIIVGLDFSYFFSYLHRNINSESDISSKLDFLYICSHSYVFDISTLSNSQNIATLFSILHKSSANDEMIYKTIHLICKLTQSQNCFRIFNRTQYIQNLIEYQSLYPIIHIFYNIVHSSPKAKKNISQVDIQSMNKLAKQYIENDFIEFPINNEIHFFENIEYTLKLLDEQFHHSSYPNLSINFLFQKNEFFSSSPLPIQRAYLQLLLSLGPFNDEVIINIISPYLVNHDSKIALLSIQIVKQYLDSIEKNQEMRGFFEALLEPILILYSNQPSDIFKEAHFILCEIFDQYVFNLQALQILINRAKSDEELFKKFDYLFDYFLENPDEPYDQISKEEFLELANEFIDSKVEGKNKNEAYIQSKIQQFAPQTD